MTVNSLQINPLELAHLLVDGNNLRRTSLLDDNPLVSGVELAKSLQQLCYDVWANEPTKVAAIVDTLKQVAEYYKDGEIDGYAVWSDGIKHLVNGKLDNCLNCLDEAENIFSNLGKFHLAAETQTSRLYALALLGRYDDAVRCGEQARKVFAEQGDLYSLGKIEHNIGNLFARRDLYRKSEPYFESARKNFAAIDDQRQLAMVENSQAFTKSLQNKFRDAEVIYTRALIRAEANELTVTAAEIETGLSNLHLFQGHYDQALKFMEKARQKYESLGMPGQFAICELEIADLYLELNLLAEAIEFYQKAEFDFEEIGMQGELARASLNHARAMLFLGKTPDALRLLDRSEELYKKENNLIAAASAKLVRAQILLKENNTEAAETEARDALATCERGGNLRFALFARWLLGEISRENGDVEAAMRYLKTALARAGGESNQIEYLCLVSLGKTTGDEIYFRKAVDLIENSRSTLVSPELRTAFFSEKIIPYNELVKLELVRGNVDDALRWHERSRSRTLLEGMERLSADTQPNDKLLKIREELDWYYSRIHRQTATGLEARSANASLRKLALKSEKKYAELLRRSQVNGNFAGGQAVDVDIARFQSHLAETTVVEFLIFDQRISAFIITSNGLHALPHYVNEGLVNLEIRQLLFQIKTSRFHDRLSPDNRKLANERLLRHCEKLYDLLIRPIESLFNGERLVFMPAGILHYLPFQSLNDGLGFMIERFEISYAPSIIALQTCLSAPSRGRQNAVFAGVADERAPLVEDEIATISGLFDHSTCLLNADATLHNLSLNLTDADVVHLACHGNFRPDNPAFSSLSLYDENLTVNEVRNMRLTGRMIVLSACESGLNDVVKGEELVGLTRAFFEAGASTLVQSLWNVSDRSTLELMKIFYREFIRGSDPAAALRVAQRALIDAESSPYLWAPFIVSGRW